MIRFPKMLAIARFELISTLRRPSYLIATFGMPLLLLLYGVLVTFLGTMAGRIGGEVKIYGVVDHPGVLGLDGDSPVGPGAPDDLASVLESLGQQHLLDRTLAVWGNELFRPFAAAADAHAALASGELRAYFVLPTDYVASGRLEEYAPDRFDTNRSEARDSLSSLLHTRLLEGRVSEEIAARARRPIASTRAFTVTPDGSVEEGQPAARALRIIVPLAFTGLLVLSMIMSSGYLVHGTAVEKENRVVDVLLSAADPDEILAGKLLGLGAAGLLQLFVWFSMAIAGLVGFAAGLSGSGYDVPWGTMAVIVVYFVVTYLFFGSLMVGTGALGSNVRESQQLSGAWTILIVLPLLFLAVLLEAPHGTMGRSLTWIPFTAPVTVVLRLTLDPSGVAWWEIVGPILVLVASTWAALLLGARLFRVGLLFTGSRPKLAEIWRQARIGR